MPARKRAARKAAAKPVRAKKTRGAKRSDKWERVVVDEVFDSGEARLLRAKRLKGHPDDDLGIHTWGKESPTVLGAGQVEAFVGFPSDRKLAEGDVFFLKDGSLLRSSYRGSKIIARKLAQKRHLLKHWDESRETARDEIKQAFFELTATRLTDNKRTQASLKSSVRRRVRRK